MVPECPAIYGTHAPKDAVGCYKCPCFVKGGVPTFSMPLRSTGKVREGEEGDEMRLNNISITNSKTVS